MPIPDIDIWRSAKLLIDRHGKDAAMEAAHRANRALEASDQANYETWQRIAMAITDFWLRKSSDGEQVH